MLSNYSWSGPVTYGFTTSVSNYESNYGEALNGFSAISDAQRQAIRYILEGSSTQAGGPVFKYGSFESVIELSISESAGSGSGLNTADIRVGQSTSANPSAYAYYPLQGSSGHAGDVWFGSSYNYREPVVGTYAWATHIHELGHSMGLKHGHATSGYGALPAEFDGLEFSIMTYRSYVGGPADYYRVESYGGPQTLMMYDIAALQSLYGADFTTNASNTVYRWNPTTGEMSLNGVGQGAPGGGIGGAANRVLLTVWDGGGVDTYDMSNYASGVSIDLRPGQWSITSQAQRSDLDALNPGQHYANGNVYNALLNNGDTRSYIENAIGGAGADVLVGNDIANTLLGNAGADTLSGGAADDVLHGGAGNDLIYGGDGIDTVVFDGLRSQYQVTTLADGARQVLDLRGGSPDGLDTILDVEIFRFADGTASLSEVIESTGSTSLVKLGDQYFVQGGDGSSIALKYLGGAVVANQFPGWAPIAVEASADGYNLTWKATGADQYTVWHLDSSGNFASSLSGIVSGSDFGLQMLETGFQQDLNGNGQIGVDTIVVETQGSASLSMAAGRFFMHQSDGSGAASLKYLGAEVVAGQFPGWTPISVNAVAGGYDVAFKATGTEQYVIWHTDAAGNYASSVTGIVTGRNGTLQQLEIDFQQDINNDGTIGVSTTAIETNGATGLTAVGDRFYFDNGSMVGPSFKYLGTDVIADQFLGWSPIAVEARNGEYDVVWKSDAADQFIVWRTNGAGHYASNVTGLVSGDSYGLQSLEDVFAQDLNNDGTVGLVTTSIETSGSTDLVAVADRFFFETAGAAGPSFKYLGTDVIASQFGGWAPIAAEARAGGYDVIWKLQGADQYTAWHTDSNGNYASSLTGVVSGADTKLQSLETSLRQDFTNDGWIGTAPTTGQGQTTVSNDGLDDLLSSGAGTVEFASTADADAIEDVVVSADAIQQPDPQLFVDVAEHNPHFI